MKQVWLLQLAMALAGCAPQSDPPTYAAPDEAARIRRACPEGTFIGTMTVNCPQIVR